MVRLLIDNPVLLLVVVSALGYVLGQVRLGGSTLGVAAVLFAGLFVGSLHPELRLPEFTTQLGLILFVYAIGLSSGVGFFAAFRRKGVRNLLFVAGLLVLAALVAAGAAVVLGLRASLVAGLFAGSLTSTPSLAGVVEYIRTMLPPEVARQLVDDPVIGYSIAYPMGVVGVLLVITVLLRYWKVDFSQDAQRVEPLGPVHQPLRNYSIRITRPEVHRYSILAMVQHEGWEVIFGRVQHVDGRQELISGTTRLIPGDIVTVVGTEEAVNRVRDYLGEPAPEHLAHDRRQYDYRRIFVSNPKVAGRPLRELDFLQQMGVIVTRVRRGDAEWLAHGDTVLEPGDRVRVLARTEDLPALSTYFGDSYRALSEVNLLTLSLGLTAGMLLGMIPIPLPGGLVFKLGPAGGPLLVGLVLGKVAYTGSLLWYLPYSANLLLRQLGLVLFFAGVGTRAGYAFVTTLTQGSGVLLFLAGTAITCTTTLAALLVGYKLLHIPMSQLLGMVAGVHTQPAVLGYAVNRTGNDLPNLGYATIFPIASILKILIAQLLLLLLS